MTATDATTVDVQGYLLRLDRAYERTTHVWLQQAGAGAVRLGLDPLGVEINGTLAQFSLLEPGDRVEQGRPFGHLEAAKFVGPLLSPVTGTVNAVNTAVLAAPGAVERDPFGSWLVELTVEPAAEAAAGPDLLHGRDEIVAWFDRKVTDYRSEGVLAE